MYTTEPITNVTFYLPLPVRNGVPLVGQVVLHESDFAWNNLSFEIVASPPDLNLTGAYPMTGNEPKFLKISTERVYLNETQDGSYLLYVRNNTCLESPLSFADTVDPYFNETVFLPKLNFALPASNERMNGTSPYPVPYDYQLTPIKVSQQIPIYAEYSASPTTRVTISSTISGANVWKEGYDAWISNSYADYYDWYHYGDSHGWQTASGAYEAARGEYPNLSHPVWQEVLNRTPEQ